MGRYLPEAWPLPAVDDLTRDFFTTGKLLLQQCMRCGTVQHPPEEVCYRCQGMEFRPVESAGRGTIYSFMVTHHPVSPALREAVPYNIALVQLDDYPDIRVIGNVLNVPNESLAIGMPVRAVWEDVTDKASGDRLLIPQWEPA
jgi:uncharacterized OB-fold protein